MILIYLIFLAYICGLRFGDAQLGAVHPCRNDYRNLAKRIHYIYILSFFRFPIIAPHSTVSITPTIIVLPANTAFRASFLYTSGIPPDGINYHRAFSRLDRDLFWQINWVCFIITIHRICASRAISPLLVTILTDFVPFFIMIGDTR